MQVKTHYTHCTPLTRLQGVPFAGKPRRGYTDGTNAPVQPLAPTTKHDPTRQTMGAGLRNISY
jgi:hypothetical protein